MQEPSSEQRFTREEVGDLIETATRLDHLSSDPDPGLTLAELRIIASELGISDQALLEAVATRLDRQRQGTSNAVEVDGARSAWQKRLKEWRIHLGSYLSVIAGLLVIDSADGSGDLDWFFFPAAGWGMGLLIHTVVVWANRPSELRGAPGL